MSAPRPRVVVHVAVSLDGATTGFQPLLGVFYELAATWPQDVTLVGADTILAQEQALADAPRRGPKPDGPLLAVVDGLGRVREWGALRTCGHWRDVLALSTPYTPDRGGDVQELVSGRRRVDLAAALDTLAERHGARTVRVDSGGALIGALLGQHLVDELSLLIHPCVVGADSERAWTGPVPPPSADLELIAARTVADGLLWTRYRCRSGCRP